MFHSFTCYYPVFPAPFIEETIFSPLSIFDSLVKYYCVYSGPSTVLIILHTVSFNPSQIILQGRYYSLCFTDDDVKFLAVMTLAQGYRSGEKL